MRVNRATLLAAVLVLGITACKGEDSGTSALFAQEDTPENLKALLDAIVHESEKGDPKKAGALLRGLLPTERTLKKAFRDGVPGDVVARLAANLERVPTDDTALVGALRRGDPSQTQINVHGATAEEIAAQSTAAAREFPGGAKEHAGLLRPGLRFYEAEFVTPGEALGMKYHLFFWDGRQWRMLGPIWRTLE